MKLVVYFSFLLFGFQACNSTNDSTKESNPILGKWEWIESSGGITGATTTPASTNTKNQLEISDTTVKRYVNGVLVATDSYSIETKKSIFGGEKQMLVYKEGNPSQSFSVLNDKLVLNDECYDCYQSKYSKKQQ